MRTYEVMVILDPSLEERTVEPSLDKYLNVVRKDGGSVESVDVWGRRRLAYEIDHKADGTYHLLQFDAEPETLDELTRILKITDGVMRHLATRRIKGGHGPGRPGPEPVESVGREPEYARANTRSQQTSVPDEEE